MLLRVMVSLIIVWALLEVLVRKTAQRGIETDFYGSIPRDEVQFLQAQFGVKVSVGRGWTHLGWIADPERESYIIQQEETAGSWMNLARTTYGSFLSFTLNAKLRVVAVGLKDGAVRVVGEVEVAMKDEQKHLAPAKMPKVVGPWQPLFRPEKAGTYINDHCLYRDAGGHWRLLGITSHGKGDYRKEKQLAVGEGAALPPDALFRECEPIADMGELAWAPDVVKVGERYHLFWSPHKLHHMTSDDGIHWEGHEIIMDKPMHPFFRDAKIVPVAPGQWLLYATARGMWFSRIDLYQSFDLVHWQYIRPALRGVWGSEKNFVTGSLESPFLFQHDDQYYLSATYNNESFFWPPILLELGIFVNRKDYNNTLIFQAQNPYDFGEYRGKRHSPTLLTRIEAHAPVYIEVGGSWYLTTCGWPFAATLTEGEVAVSPLIWQDEGAVERPSTRSAPHL